jgi:glycosyltransferase involved in cell wall biosynthesis
MTARSRAQLRTNVRTKVASFDLAAPAPLFGVADVQGVQLLVRHGAIPLGWLRLWPEATRDAYSADELVRAARAVFGEVSTPPPAIQAHSAISVVVCTRDRPRQLRACLTALLALQYPHVEIIVVDNASRDAATRDLADAAGVRYAREERPGLDHARNHGWRVATHELIAFTDDDVRVDPHWLQGIALAFGDPGVDGVTGLIAPLELITPAQRRFELYGGMGKGFASRRFDGRDMSPADMLAAHQVGVGANMAFRRAMLERVNGFDPHLDVGTPSHGAGDLDLLHRVLAAGGCVQYEPQALVWHQHRRAMTALHRQVRDNQRSFGCYLLRRWRLREVPRRAIAAFALKQWLGGWLLRGLVSRHPGRALPLVLSEWAGALSAPWAYRQTYRT